MKKSYTVALLLALLAFPGRGQELEMKENKEFTGLGAYVSEAAFSPFGDYFAYSLANNILRVFDRNWDKVFEHQGDPESGSRILAFSPDGEYLAFARYKGKTDIAILRLSDRRIVQVLDRHSSYVYDLEFSHDGNYLASTSNDYTMILWKRSGEEFGFLQEFGGFESYLYQSSFSSDDRFLATGDSYGNVKVYERKEDGYGLFQEFKNRKHAVNSIVFRPAGNELLTGSSSQIRRYILKGKEFILNDSVYKKVGVRSPMCFSPRGEFLSVPYYTQVKVYRVHRDSLQEVDVTHRHTSETSGSSFSENGKFLATYGGDERIIIWEVANVAPSPRAEVSGWLLGNMSLAQRRSLTPEVLARIMADTPPGMSAPRDEFEKTLEYNARMEKLSDHALAMLQEEMEKKYGIRAAGNTVSFPLSGLLGYNADLEIYKISMLDTEAGVRIPVDDARKLKTDWMSVMIRGDRSGEQGKSAGTYKNFRLEMKGSGETFEVIPVENPFHLSTGPERPGRGPSAEATGRTAGDTVNGSTYAVLFASNVYDYFGDLVNPVLDAQTISAELAENYSVITEVLTNPTLEETAAKLREYASGQYGKKDNLLVFFAGHGIYDEVFREGYVISRDSKNDDIGKTSYLSHSNLRTMINNIDCPHIFLVMDVCFGGTFDPHLASTHRGTSIYADITPAEFVERKLQYKTRLYLTSGGKEYVPDGRPGFHSPFARRFIESLRYYGGDDGVLTTAEILQFVEKVSPQPRFGEFGDNEPGSDFILVLKQED